MIPTKDVDQRCFIRSLLKLPAIVALILIGWLPVSSNAFEILLGTGEAGTFSHYTGRILCRVINNHTDGVQCEMVPEPDAVDLLTNLRGGSLDIGLVDARMLLDAISRKGNFEFLDIDYTNLRILIPLYDVPVTLAARPDAGIGSLNDLKGKRINAGAPRSAEHRAVEIIMGAKGWSEKDFPLVQGFSSSQSEDSMAFCHGTIQAMVRIGVHPNASLQQLIELCNANLVNMDDGDIDKMILAHGSFSKITIPAGTYPSQGKPVTTFGTKMLLIASQDFDEETAYSIIDAIYRNQKRLKNAHPALSSLTPDAARNYNINLQRHPGAVRYFSGP